MGVAGKSDSFCLSKAKENTARTPVPLHSRDDVTVEVAGWLAGSLSYRRAKNTFPRVRVRAGRKSRVFWAGGF